ncbi:UNVERIFIED_CONTAM: hypothetical protein Sangu_1021600 [Sesamum angustifolium]|uniref:Uncharacterized protein n=1 Tax=Sesamum angustifolium TaxID=2727405 RepID=A0AAW2NXI1_9LAMI
MFQLTMEQRLGTRSANEIKTDNQVPSATKSGPWRKMLPSKDANFMGYTYKNFEIVNDHEVSGIDERLVHGVLCTL